MQQQWTTLSHQLSHLELEVGEGDMHPHTLFARRRLYLLARVVVARHYRRRLTLAVVAGALSSSPRQLQRAYAQFGEITFREDLLARRMTAAAQLLVEQPAIAVRDVARLVGYQQASHFARVFRRRYGLSPARFRDRGSRHRATLLAAAGGLYRGEPRVQVHASGGAPARRVARPIVSSRPSTSDVEMSSVTTSSGLPPGRSSADARSSTACATS